MIHLETLFVTMPGVRFAFCISNSCKQNIFPRKYKHISATL